jgi:hypothetical protein
MHAIPRHFHLLISAAGCLKAVQPAHQLNLWWEAPDLEIDTKKPEKTVLIFLSREWKMITQ